MNIKASIYIGLCLFSLAYSAKPGKIFFPDKVKKVEPVPVHQPVAPASDEPDTITIEIPSNAENVKHEGDVQKINYEPDKGHLALEYQKKLVDDYYWPIPMGFGYGYAYPPPSAYTNGYNSLGNAYGNYVANPNIYNTNGYYSYPYSGNIPYNTYNFNGYNVPYNYYANNNLYNTYPYGSSDNSQYYTYPVDYNLYNTYPYASTGNNYGAYGPYSNLYPTQ